MAKSGDTRRRFLTTIAAVAAASPLEAAPPGRTPGAGRRVYGERSGHESSARWFAPTVTPGTGASRTPIQDLAGVITPSGLHFERHHSGVPELDPATHELLVHGLVQRPLVLTLADLRRLPSVSRIHFLERAGNSGREHAGRPGEDAQKSHGLVSSHMGRRGRCRCVAARSEHSGGEGAGRCDRRLRPERRGSTSGTGLPTAPAGAWLGGKPQHQVAPSIAVGRRSGDVEGRSRQLHRFPAGRTRTVVVLRDGRQVGDHAAERRPVFARARSSRDQRLARSGRGRIARVEVSADGGGTWFDAALSEPVLPKAVTRFTLPWEWDGRERWIQSRATDDTGDVQPTREALIAVRGLNPGPDGFNHYNGIKGWRIQPSGAVTHV